MGTFIHCTRVLLLRQKFLLRQLVACKIAAMILLLLQDSGNDNLVQKADTVVSFRSQGHGNTTGFDRPDHCTNLIEQ